MAITAAEARRLLFSLIQQVNDNRPPVEITSKGGNAVLMAAEDYEAWKETAYLFSNPANARRLLDSFEQSQVGHVDRL
jgi:antitoxin YefM